MTDVLEQTEPEAEEQTPAVAADFLDRRPASWSARAAAFAIDVLAGAGALATLMLTGWSAPLYGWLWWVCMVLAAVVVLAVGVNRLLLPVVTGWSLGRSVAGIRVVCADGAPVSPWRLLLRDVAHLLDTVPLLVGWFWPLWDVRGRTFADYLARTEVHRVEGPRPDRLRLAGAVVAAAAGTALVAAGLGYLTVYRPERAVAAARASIAAEAPKIVPQILSYTVPTMQQDFERARSLVTDAYRPELTAQQDAVRKAGAVDNDYWVSDSAVLSASADRARMLLLMHGQRGKGDKQRLITATLRVDFEKSGAGQWQVSNIAVLATPNVARQGQ